jgi:hypothetical protein
MDKMKKMRTNSKDPSKDSLLSHDHLSSTSGNGGGAVNTALVADDKSIKGLTTAEVEALYEQWGYNELPSIVIPLWYIFLTQFTGTMPYM